MSYRPLPPYVTIGKSKIDGLGLFATDDIDKNHVIGITHKFDKDADDGYIRTPLGGFFNHSETPNCEVIYEGDYIKLKTLTEIKSGDELTARYTLYDPTK